LFKCGKALEVFWVFGEFLDKVGLTSLPNWYERSGFPYLREAKSNKSGLTDFRNRPDQFGMPAAMSVAA
jgi:hypothetical protein